MSVNQNGNYNTISDFKWSILRGGEIVFTHSERSYGVFFMRKTPEAPRQFFIGESYNDNDQNWYDTVDELLNHVIDGKKLREIITTIEVTERNL